LIVAAGFGRAHQLPMELAVEFNELILLQMEASVG
jgi:Fe-S cluster assembly scaffold protein SufB